MKDLNIETWTVYLWLTQDSGTRECLRGMNDVSEVMALYLDTFGECGIEISLGAIEWGKLVQALKKDWCWGTRD